MSGSWLNRDRGGARPGSKLHIFMCTAAFNKKHIDWKTEGQVIETTLDL
jgi:hypothetical protein